METLDAGLRTVTKHMRLPLILGGIAHFRVGEVVMIVDVGPRLALVTGGEHKQVRFAVKALGAYQGIISVAFPTAASDPLPISPA